MQEFNDINDARTYAEGIIATIREALIVLDEELRVVSANRAFYNVFPTAGQEIRGQYIYDLGNRQWDIPELRKLLEETVQHGKQFDDFEVEHDFPGTGHKIMLLNGRRIDLGEGKRKLVLLAIEDATERVQAGNTVRESEERYHKFIEGLNSIIIGFDRAGKITFFNRFAEELFGYSRAEVLGKDLVGTVIPVHDSDGKDNSGLIPDVLGHPEKYYIIESVGVKKNGEKLWFSWSAKAVRDSSGNVTEILIDGNDITSEREQRRETREAYELLDNTPDIAAQVDARRRYTFANEAGAHLVRRPKEKIIGKTFGELGAPPETAAIFNRMFDEAARAREPRTFEARYGERYFQTIMVPRTNESGAVAAFMLFGRDITELKKAEEVLRESGAVLSRAQAIAHIGSWKLELGPQTAYCSDEFFRILGIPRPEVYTYGDFEKSVHPDDRAIPLARIAEMAKSKGGAAADYRIVRPDGEVRHVHAEGEYGVEEGKEIEFGTLQDITRSKKAEEVLKVNEQKMKALLNAVDESILMIDMHDTVIAANETAARRLGKSVAEVVGKKWYELRPHDAEILRVIELRKEKIDETIRTGAPVNFEDEREGMVFSHGFYPVRDAAGTVIGVVSFSRDITGQKKAEKALRESREDLNRAQAVGRLGSWRLDVRRNALTWSDEAYRIFSVPRGTPLTYETFLSYVHPDDREYVDRMWKAALTGEPYDIEHRIIVEGDVKWVRERAELEFDRHGTLLGGFGIVQDIAERKKTEESLRRSEERYHILFNSIDEGFCIIEVLFDEYYKPVDYRFLEINAAFEKQTGLHEALGKRMRELAPTHEAYWFDIYGKIALTGEPARFTNEAKALHRWYDVYAFQVGGQGSKKVAILFKDITEQKKAEETLRRNEYELRTLVDNSPDIVFRLNRHIQYTYVNPAYERITGLTKEHFISKTNSQLGMPQQMVEFWQSAARAVIDSGRERSAEFDMISFFGKRYFFARLIPEFEKSGLVETVLVIARDITERKRAEEQIRYISFHDEVTGLFNRAFFEEEIHRVDTERDLPASIIMGDVNNLKLSNDVFGHEEGDKLLSAIADIFRKACRKNDIIARWGGDEFAVILPGTDLATAKEICSRVKQIARETKGTGIQPSIALGIATKERKDQNIYRTIRQAEERMYQNKLDESKANEECVYESLFARARERNKDMDAHIERSNARAAAFSKELDLSESQRDDLFLLIKLHDIGDAVIPEGILTKPGRLTPAEWEMVKKHPEAGLRIVKVFVDTARISDEVFSHGERWDGTGYPRELKEKDIPYLVRVFQIVDAFDVMTHSRPYARTFTREEAIDELRRNAGRQFDPDLVEKFIQAVNREAVTPGETV